MTLSSTPSSVSLKHRVAVSNFATHSFNRVRLRSKAMFLEVHAWSTGHTTSNGVYIYNGKEKMYGKVGPRLVSCKGIDSFVLLNYTSV